MESYCYASRDSLVSVEYLTATSRVFDGYEEKDLPDGNRKGIALQACGVMDNGGGELELSHYLARYQHETPTPEAGWKIELAAFANASLKHTTRRLTDRLVTRF